MAFVKHLPPVTREVPHEPGHTMTFRRLSADEVDDVRASVLREALAKVDTRMAETMRLLTDPNDPVTQEARRLAMEDNDPMTGYSEKALVRYGVVDWSGPDYPAFSPDFIEEMDVETRAWAAREIIAISTITPGEAKRLGDGGENANGASPLSATAISA